MYHYFEYAKGAFASRHEAQKPGGRLVLVDFKRTPGRSAGLILNHLWTGQEVFEVRIAKTGFAKARAINNFPSDSGSVIFKKTLVLKLRGNCPEIH